MINKSAWLSVLSTKAQSLNKSVPTLKELESALSAIDEQAVIQSWRSRIEAKMWDGLSDINTATPEYIRESNPWLDVVYVLLIDGAVVYMQTHNPFQEGYIPITAETVDAISNQHANEIANHYAQNQIFEEVLNKLGLAALSTPSVAEQILIV